MINSKPTYKVSGKPRPIYKHRAMLLHDRKLALLRRYEYTNGLKYYEPLRRKI